MRHPVKVTPLGKVDEMARSEPEFAGVLRREVAVLLDGYLEERRIDPTRHTKNMAFCRTFVKTSVGFVDRGAWGTDRDISG